MNFSIAIVWISGFLLVLTNTFSDINDTAKAISCCFGIFLCLSPYLAMIFNGKKEG